MVNRFNYFPVFNLLLLLTLAVISYLLTLVPLTNVLGYEFSVVIGILLSLFGGLSNINFKRKVGNLNRQYWFYAAAALTPLTISAVFTHLNNLCPVENGIPYYLVFAIPSFLIGIFLGRISFFISKKFSFIIFILLWLLIILFPLYELYYYPQIYFYNPIIGFYPGIIYDESITISAKLLIYRLVTLAFFYYASIFAASSRSRKKYSFPVIIIVFITFFFAKPFLGFATNEYILKKELSVRIKTEHFEIYLPPSVNEKRRVLIANLHEYYYNEISEKLGFEPSQKVETFIFENAGQKKELFGAGSADVTKIWSNQIFTDRVEETLEHELIHIFSAKIGVTPLKVAENFNPAMIEGFATAVENQIGEHTVHYMAALALNSGFKIDLQNMFTGFNFFGSASSVGYIYSGSFIKFLIDRYGINEVKKLYGDIDFKRYFGKSLRSLSREHEEFLQSLNFAFNQNFGTLTFGYKPLVSKACPRFIANKLQEGWNSYQHKDFEGSKEIFSEILNISENYSALSGYVYSSQKTGDYLTAVQKMIEYRTMFENTSYYYAFELLLADMFSLNNEFYESAELYELLSEQKPSAYYYSLSKVRSMLLDDNRLKEYISGSDFDKFLLLTELNGRKINSFAIPVLINLSEKLQQSYSSFIGYVESRNIWEDESADYSYYRLSQYSFWNGDLKRAEEYLLKSMDISTDKDAKRIGEKELRKIKWLRKNLE